MRRYLPQLDGLRAIAVTLVVLDHAFVLKTGYLGVEIFFILSGYLITTILLNERESGDWSLRRFYGRRMRRLYPALMLMLVATLPLDPIIVPGSIGHRMLMWFSAATYTSGYARAFSLYSLGGLGHTWSLSIEEQFYLLWPLALVWLIADKARFKVLLALTSVALVALMVAPDHLLPLPVGGGAIIMLGCMLALVVRDRSLPHPQSIAIGSATLLALLLAFGPRGASPAPYGAAIVIAGTLSVGLIGGVLHGGWLAGLLSSRLLVWVGKRSYGIYLWHAPLLAALPRPLNPFAAIGVIAGSVCCAALSYRWVEPRFRRRSSERPDRIGIAPNLGAEAGVR